MIRDGARAARGIPEMLLEAVWPRVAPEADAAPALALGLYREFRHGDDVSPLAVEGLVLEILAEASRRILPAPAGLLQRPFGGRGGPQTHGSGMPSWRQIARAVGFGISRCRGTAVRRPFAGFS
jgi:hypothetical protein